VKIHADYVLFSDQMTVGIASNKYTEIIRSLQLEVYCML